MLVAVVAVLGAYVAYLAQADRSFEAQFRGVAEGATRAQVIARLGTPDAVRESCRDLPTWMNRPVLATCAEELEFHAGLKGVFWTIGFDADGKAISKYRYVAR